MIREEIIRMARESGHSVIDSPEPWNESLTLLEAFARLIAEDCAKRCEAIAADFESKHMVDCEHGADMAAIAIREAYKP